MMEIVIGVLIVLCLFQAYYIRTQRRVIAEKEKMTKMKTAYLKALGYDFRNPLHDVVKLAQTISKENLYLSKEEKRNISDQIQFNTDLISTLLDETTTITEEDSTGHQLKDERFSPNRVCQRCIDANLPYLKEGVKLVFNQHVAQELFILQERHLIELILNKLTYSACRYTEKGQIAVGCFQDDTQRYLTFFVEDTGIGIPEDRKAHMFTWLDEPDFQVEDTEIYFSVAQRLAERIGGYLRYDDSYIKGTRIEFTVPIH